MGANKKIKVLVVDDSLIFREVIARGISSDEEIEVVAKAMDPFDARDKILEFEPNVMICDVVMPKMDGIEFLEKLLPQYPIPVIIMSSVSDAVFDAMNAGALDFVSKPNVQSAKSVELFIMDLIAKVKVAAKAKVTRKEKAKEKAKEKLEEKLEVKERNVTRVDECDVLNHIIAIGASTGGTEAIYQLLKRLPSTTPGILIVQHIPPTFSTLFAKRLDAQTNFHVREAKTGDYLEQGMVLLAPGDRHMKIKKIGDNYRVEVFEGEKVNGHCPSVDLLFESVAKEAGENAIGIILTGMGYDGAKGLLMMRRKGARTIGQNEQSSVVYGMPKVAYEVGAVEKQVDLYQIPSVVNHMLRKG